MTDTHTHLYMDDFSGEKREVVSRAIEAGVTRMVFPGVSPAEVPDMESLHAEFPDNTLLGAGIHPTELGENWRDDLTATRRLLDKPEYRAVGEVGIDLHWDKSNLEEQKEAFATQLGWAIELNLPLIIHSRDALEETLDVLKTREGELPTMIFHSFTAGPGAVERIREVCDPYFGINGVVTFKNARELREALPLIGIDRIVLETDAPWLAPVPHRGMRNESAYIPDIRDKVAETLGLSPDEVEKATDRNAERIFRF